LSCIIPSKKGLLFLEEIKTGGITMEKFFDKEILAKVQFKRDGFLVDIILQNYITKDVLFGASMSREILEETIKRGVVVLFSKSRKVRWVKGETSGNFLRIMRIMLNCDCNQLLIQVIPLGEGVCHEVDEKGKARPSCFSKLLVETEVFEEGGKNYIIRDGRKEEVNSYVPYGWFTDDELFKLRQSDPRYAP
jgi:phosphoribosyl-AMP cyclohydrolase